MSWPTRGPGAPDPLSPRLYLDDKGDPCWGVRITPDNHQDVSEWMKWGGRWDDGSLAPSGPNSATDFTSGAYTAFVYSSGWGGHAILRDDSSRLKNFTLMVSAEELAPDPTPLVQTVETITGGEILTALAQGHDAEVLLESPDGIDDFHRIKSSGRHDWLWSMPAGDRRAVVYIGRVVK